MRIIHILHSHGYGGAEQHVVILMRGQMARGHDVCFVGPLDSWLGKACQQHGIPCKHLTMTGLFDLASHWRLRQFVRQFQADVVHGHLIRGAWYAGWAVGRGGAAGRPLAVASAHTTNALKHMGRCDHIIADSAAIRDRLLNHGYASNGVSVIYTGVPPAPAVSRQTVRDELGLHDDDIVIGHAGRFVKDKGQDVLVRALASCHHPRLKLVLIGDPQTAYGRHVQGLAPASDRVRYLGYRSDVPRLLRALDLYVQPSRREGLPLAISEAFDAGLPVVATAVGGMPEVVQHRLTGMLVRSQDPALMAEAIDELAGDPALAKRLGQQAQAFYQGNLTDAVLVTRTLACYDSLRHGGSAGQGHALSDLAGGAQKA